MSGMAIAVLIWLMVNFAIIVVIARWIFKVNKTVELLEEISAKATVIIQNQHSDRKQEPPTKPQGEERYWPKN